MAEKVWTAGELERMSPEERTRIFRAGIVWDVDEAPQELLARIRARAQARIDGAEAGADG
jgi:hypothetical protein